MSTGNPIYSASDQADQATCAQKSKAPPCGGAMSRVFWANQQILGYAPISLRRNMPAIPTSPVPRRPKVPGSGTVSVVLPTVRMCPIPLVQLRVNSEDVLGCGSIHRNRPVIQHASDRAAELCKLRFLTPGALVRVQVIGPTKLPLKSVTFRTWRIPGNPFAQAPRPVTTNVEPVAENVPPAAIEPLAQSAGREGHRTERVIP